MVQRCGANSSFAVNAMLFNCWSFVKVMSLRCAKETRRFAKVLENKKEKRHAEKFSCNNPTRLFFRVSLRLLCTSLRNSYRLSCKAKTRLNKSEVRAFKSFLIFFSSTATILKTPFSASLVT